MRGLAKISKTPCMVVVCSELSKARRQYFSFYGGVAAGRIANYLNDRIERGEWLNVDSPIIAPDHVHPMGRGMNAGKEFLPTQQISWLMRRTLCPRFGWRPYVLRAAFATNTLVAESRVLIAHDFHVFFMGHTGTMQMMYMTNKAHCRNCWWMRYAPLSGEAETPSYGTASCT